MKNVIDIDIAKIEIESWLEYKKVNDKKREVYADSIQTLSEAISDGTLRLNAETKYLTHLLKFEIGEDYKVKELEYKPRLQVGVIQNALQGVKSNDADGRVGAYISALTGKGKELIKKMDTEDYSVAQAIAIFFI